METQTVTVLLAQGGVEMNLWETVAGSGPVVFGVLALLVLASVMSWGIIAYKYMGIRKAQLQSMEFLEQFWQSKRLESIYQASERLKKSPLAQVFRAGYVELAKVKRSATSDDAEGGSLAAQLGGMENVERSMRRTTAAEVTNLEALIPFLATVGSTGPFIGLFGTVWGIMKAFADIGTQGQASLAVVAGPISEALVATAAGLAAAIPAVMAYNFFLARIRVLSTEMDNFQADFLNIIKRHFKL